MVSSGLMRPEAAVGMAVIQLLQANKEPAPAPQPKAAAPQPAPAAKPQPQAADDSDRWAAIRDELETSLLTQLEKCEVVLAGEVATITGSALVIKRLQAIRRFRPARRFRPHHSGAQAQMKVTAFVGDDPVKRRLALDAAIKDRPEGTLNCFDLSDPDQLTPALQSLGEAGFLDQHRTIVWHEAQHLKKPERLKALTLDRFLAGGDATLLVEAHVEARAKERSASIRWLGFCTMRNRWRPRPFRCLRLGRKRNA